MYANVDLIRKSWHYVGMRINQRPNRFHRQFTLRPARKVTEGMTLLELVIVAAILGILSMSAVSYYNDYMQQAREAVARQNLKLVRDAVSKYFKENLEGPTSFTQLGLNVEDSILGKLDDPNLRLGIVVSATSSFSGVSPNPYLATEVAVVFLNRGSTGNGQSFRDIKISSPYSSW